MSSSPSQMYYPSIQQQPVAYPTQGGIQYVQQNQIPGGIGQTQYQQINPQSQVIQSFIMPQNT